jgi:hypothetical protein
MFEFSVEMQGLKVLPKPQFSTREMGKISALGFDIHEMYKPRRRNIRKIL